MNTHFIPNEAFGITDEEIQEWAESKKKGHWTHFNPSFVGTHAPKVDVGAIRAHMNNAQAIFQAGRIGQAESRVKIKTNVPITVFHIGDVHLGSVYTDHDRFLDDLEAIKRMPNAYICLMSNLIDNAIPAQFPGGMLVNGIPPDKQVMAMRKIVMELDAMGKVLGAVTSPCHEGWTYTHTGQDINALLFDFPRRKFPVLENGGRLHIRVGKVEYIEALYHMVGPFESNFNETHALRQMNRLRQNMECDVVAGAHKHYAAAELVWEGTGEHRKLVAYIRTGSYKGVGEVHDLWAQDRFGVTGEPSGQAVTLWPDTKRMAVHLELHTALDLHEAYCRGQLMG